MKINKINKEFEKIKIEAELAHYKQEAKKIPIYCSYADWIDTGYCTERKFVRRYARNGGEADSNANRIWTASGR